MTAPRLDQVLALVDPWGVPPGHLAAAGADGVLDLLAAAGGLSAASRRAYPARPFDHHAPAGDPEAFEQGLSPLARRLGGALPREGGVLEVGSGASHWTAWLFSKGLRVLAVEQSGESPRRLRSRVDAGAVVSDATALPFRDAIFDAVPANGVIHHRTRPAIALRELVRVRRPSGLRFVPVYRAEGRRPLLCRSFGARVRATASLPPLDALVWGIAYPAYQGAAVRRYRRRREESGRHDEGVLSGCFPTPRATPMRGSALHGWLRRSGLEVLAYEPYRTVHGFLARKRGARPA